MPRRLIGGTFAVLLVLAVPSGAALQGSRAAWIDAYRAAAATLIARAEEDDFAWNRLAELTDTFGPRLSGSKNLEQAIEWAVAQLRQDGFDNVRTEPVMVPHWVRGEERLTLLEPGARPLPMLGLGGSVGTPPGGVEADLLVVDSFEALERRAAEARGRIVLFDVPYVSYGETVQYRVSGPSRAARAGAVAVLVRAVGPTGLRTPHTGALTYSSGAPAIPAASISAEDSAMLARLQARGTRVRLRLEMGASWLPDAPSANVIAELRGRERPDEVVVVGCHFDSWDVGTGASDDAAGCIAAWETLRLMKVTGLRPRRTVRLVLFANEENGLRGGAAYLEQYRHALQDHILMIESDLGVFAPLTMGFSGPPAARARIEDIARLLAPVGIHRIGPAGGGADIAPAAEAGAIPTLSIAGDMTRYFTIHHTHADTVDRIDPIEVSRAAAALAVVTYVAADMPVRLVEGTTSSR
ncbi:MAG TPA: M20/M25/M40 family metallo-hydrolase [Vicinamibacterales bacterium]